MDPRWCQLVGDQVVHISGRLAPCATSASHASLQSLCSVYLVAWERGYIFQGFALKVLNDDGPSQRKNAIMTGKDQLVHFLH